MDLAIWFATMFLACFGADNATCVATDDLNKLPPQVKKVCYVETMRETKNPFDLPEYQRFRIPCDLEGK